MRISDCSSDVCSSDLEEMPWLSDVVPFDEMRDRAVLEIGFGPGYDALSFLQAGADYHGIDLTPENIERTRKHLGYYGFERSDERRVGQRCVSKCRSRWWPLLIKKKQNKGVHR